MPEVQLRRFSLYWRLVFRTERALGRLPMLLLIPTVGAFAGTAWSVSHPVETIRHGLVVGTLSFWNVLCAAVVGGVLGLVVLLGLMFVIGWIGYRLFGDHVWEAIYIDGCFELRCKAADPVSFRDLGAVECRLKMPSGSVLNSHHAGVLAPREAPVQGIIARFLLDEPGLYEARWYALNGERRLHEIARTKTEIQADPTLVSG